MVVHPHRQDAARGFVWPHTMMMVMVVPASEVEASSRWCADHMVKLLPIFEMVTSGDGVFLKLVIRARGWIVEDAAHL